jgi:hypothetical protein
VESEWCLVCSVWRGMPCNTPAFQSRMCWIAGTFSVWLRTRKRQPTW